MAQPGHYRGVFSIDRPPLLAVRRYQGPVRVVRSPEDASEEEVQRRRPRLPRKTLGPGGEDFAIKPEINILADREIDSCAVASTLRRGCAPLGVSEQSHVGAIGVHDEYLVAGVAVRSKRDPGPVRRPRWPPVERGMVRQVPRVGAIGIRDEYLRVRLPQHPAEGETLPVRRPCRVRVDTSRNEPRNSPSGYVNYANI